MASVKLIILTSVLFTLGSCHGPLEPIKRILQKLPEVGFQERLLSLAGVTGKEQSILNTQRAAPGLLQTSTCESCVDLVDTVMVLVNLGLDYETVKPLVLDICIDVIGEDGVRADIICPGFLDLNAPRLIDILRTRNDDGRGICLDLNLCDPFPAELSQEPVIIPNVNRKHSAVNKNSIKVVHLTDVHVEQGYIDGSATDCGLPVCCRNEGDANGGEAGIYGDYSCNTPPRTVELILDSIAEIQPDFVLYSGDHPVHAIWTETKDSQFNTTVYFAELMAEKLPNVPVYPTIGNHELFPTNLYFLDTPETEEFNSLFAAQWTEMAGFESGQLDTIRQGGYYTMMIRPGLRLLAYNSNFGYTFNFYNLLSQAQDDFDLMVLFVRGTLDFARANNEKVLVLTHHPSNRRDNKIQYSQTINDVMVEYADVIILCVSGHTHNDEFILFSDDSNQAANVVFTSPSVTPWEDVNPSFRVYYMESESYVLQDFDQFRMDLNSTEDNPGSLVQLAYRATEEYGLSDMSPASIGDLINRFQTEEGLYDTYLANRFTSPNFVCDVDCRNTELCDIRYSTFEQVRDCYYQLGIPQL